jgi:hypothetical protein
MKTMKGTGDVKQRKTSPMAPMPLARTPKGLTGITPTGVTGTGTSTKHGMAGGKMPGMSPGGKSKGHKVPISFNFPAMKSATVAHSMGKLGAQPGGNVGINPPFKAGKVSGKVAKNQRSMKGY